MDIETEDVTDVEGSARLGVAVLEDVDEVDGTGLLLGLTACVGVGEEDDGLGVVVAVTGTDLVGVGLATLALAHCPSPYTVSTANNWVHQMKSLLSIKMATTTALW